MVSALHTRAIWVTHTNPSADAASGHERRRDGLSIALAWIAIAIILRPFQDTPFVDDWVYAWPVEQLFLGRPIKVIDYSTNLNLVQAGWGALFCLPAGFSFTALRLSTWTAALLCLWALYWLLREVHVSRRDALLGVATLAVNPIFFVLSISFMTDIPFLACTTAAMFAFVRAVSRERATWLWAATFLAALSVGIRLTGVALPIAMSLTLVLRRASWGRDRLRFLVPLAAFVFMAGLVVWHQTHIEVIADLSGVENSPENRLRSLVRYAVPFLPLALISTLPFASGTVGLTLLPLTSAQWNVPRLPVTVVVSAGVLACVAMTQDTRLSYSPPLTYASTWALGELGATESLVPNAVPVVPPWLPWSIAPLALVSGAVVMSAVWQRSHTPASVFLAWVAVGNLLLIATLWFFHDRYSLPLVPVVIALFLSAAPIRRPRWAIAVIVLLGCWSLVGVRDHLSYNAAVWRAVDDLRRGGVPVSEIDGGYVVNGWLQYAHPDQAARDVNGNVMVPWINEGGTLRYQISNSPVVGRRIIATVPYSRWLGRSGALYVLEAGQRERRGLPVSRP